ncbi:MAG: hypothetical protein HY000_12235, partial [Planctomycetes bacterium]|nr:hypothetical protein [Planctomycetota bacterium]
MTPARTKTPIRFAAQSLVLALLAGLTTLTSASPAAAQVPLNWKRPVQVKRRDGQRIVAITPLQAEAYLNRHPLRPGDEFVIGVHLTIAPNWHLFANPKGPGNVGADLTLTGVDHPSFESLPSRYPGGTRYDEPELKVWNWVYFDKATVYLPARVKDEAQTGDYMLQIELRGQVCDALNCVPFTGTAEIPVQVAAAGTPSETQHADIFASFPTTPAPPERASPEPHAQGGSDNAPPPAPLAPGPAENSQVDAPQPTTEIAVRETAPLIGRATTSAGGGGTLWAYLLSCFGLGFVAALTPCFYPMIPVTVTFFLKQAEKRGSRPLALASVYSLTIVASFTAAGAILGTALSGLGANPLLNLAFGLLLIIFGMALVGIFEIPVPQRMARWSSHGEAQGGVVGVMFMALTLLIVGTPCIAPMWGPVLA